jgi:hypothetical protein
MLVSPPRFLPPALRHEVHRVLAGVSGDEFEVLFLQMRELPVIGTARREPELYEIVCSLDDDDFDALIEEVAAQLSTLDSPELRRRLAEAIVSLRDDGGISTELAAVTLLDLDCEWSTFLWYLMAVTSIVTRYGRTAQADREGA